MGYLLQGVKSNFSTGESFCDWFRKFAPCSKPIRRSEIDLDVALALALDARLHRDSSIRFFLHLSFDKPK